MKKILLYIAFIVITLGFQSTYASDFDDIKEDFQGYFGWEGVNMINQKINSISPLKLKKIKNILESDYLPKIEKGEYSDKNSTVIQYIYFKLQDVYVDPNEVDLEVIESKRDLVKKISNGDTHVYFFENIDTWSEGTACGGIYDGSPLCYIYVERNGDISYLGKMNYPIGERTDMVFGNSIIRFDSLFGDALTSIKYEVSLNIITEYLTVKSIRTEGDIDNGGTVVTESNTESKIKK